MHNFYFENNGPIEKFLEISKDFFWGRGGGMVQYIFTIRKQHSVNKVHTLQYSVSKISEYQSRCCVFLLFCYILCRKSWYLVQCLHNSSPSWECSDSYLSCTVTQPKSIFFPSEE